MEPQKIDLGALRKQAEIPVAAEKTAVPVTAREENFRVVYIDPNGIRHETALVSRIMSGDERHVVGRMCALMANGIPFDHLPTSVQARFYALAVVSVQGRELPMWLETWIKEDAELLDAVFVALEGHESRYFRGDVQEGEESPRGSRVEVSAPHLAGA